VNIDKLFVSGLNVRYDHAFGDEEDRELIDNIESIGVLQPIVVRPKGDRYEILIGRRRFLSMQKNGVTEVPCLITDLNDDEALDASISENVFRKSVDPVTLGRWIKKRLEESDISLSEYARKIGKAKSTISEWVKMNDLSKEIQEEVQKGSVPFNYALKVARMDLSEEQEKMLAVEARNNGLDAFKNAVDRISAGKEKQKAPPGLLVVRINFGKESQEYEQLKEISDKVGMNISEYSLNILREHVRSPNR
jgi:ParB family chromosome partitioning protein